ncbi:MAG: C1 family peptidase, partial [Holophagales bacterium]|nr:C1 family peptidase [Holophagales bacterium]
RQFADDVVALDPNDYILITSFLHMPMWKASELIIPDNWFHHDEYYNIPLDDFMRVFHHALENEHSIVFAADVSEKFFKQKVGYAMLDGDFDGVDPVTPEQREEMWDRWKTTDDHGMHAVGIVKDEEDMIYYIVKNSWGAENGPHDGHIYVHENYMRGKLEAYLLHKDAVPSDILEKLGVKK